MHQVFYFCHLYIVFGIDGMNIAVHPCTIENEEALTGIRSQEIGTVDTERTIPIIGLWCAPLKEKKCALKTILLSLSFVTSV